MYVDKLYYGQWSISFKHSVTFSIQHLYVKFSCFNWFNTTLAYWNKLLDLNELCYLQTRTQDVSPSRFLLHIADKCKHFLVLPPLDTCVRHGQDTRARQGRGAITPGTRFWAHWDYAEDGSQFTLTPWLHPHFHNVVIFSTTQYQIKMQSCHASHLLWLNLQTPYRVQLSQLEHRERLKRKRLLSPSSRFDHKPHCTGPHLIIKTSSLIARCAGLAACSAGQAS